MEEKKTKQENKKLSYEELSAVANDLHIQYNKLMAEYQKVLAALNNQDMSSFLLQVLFKVMEHPEMYKDEFIKWASESIEGMVMGLAEAVKPVSEEQEKPADEGR